MKEESDKPSCQEGKSTLIIQDGELEWDNNNCTVPESGGLSCSPAPESIYPGFIPKCYRDALKKAYGVEMPPDLVKIAGPIRGSNSLRIWRFDGVSFCETRINDELKFKPDGDNHGTITPQLALDRSQLDKATLKTLDQWVKIDNFIGVAV
jgi:hypothetical protein